MLIFDEVNDVRIVGVTTATALIGIAIIGMEWEARVRRRQPILLHESLTMLRTVWIYPPPSLSIGSDCAPGYPTHIYSGLPCGNLHTSNKRAAAERLLRIL